MINTLRMDHKVITSHQFSCDFYFKAWQKMVVPADSVLCLAEPHRPCTKGFCRKVWQSPHASGELSKCHQLRHSHPTTRPYLSAVPKQTFREYSIHGTQPQNKLNRYTPFVPLWKTEKGDIPPAERMEKAWKTGEHFLYAKCVSSTESELGLI